MGRYTVITVVTSIKLFELFCLLVFAASTHSIERRRDGGSYGENDGTDECFD